MTQWRRIGLISFAIVVGLPIAGFLGIWALFSWDTHPSDIVDFMPDAFAERSESHFFYSIGNTLRFSDSIDLQAKPILEGPIKRVLVSPDKKRAAVVAGNQLIVVSGDGAPNHSISAVSSIYREPKPVGKQFVRDGGFQWSSDSRLLYYIRDEYHTSKGSQLFSQKGELWLFDTTTSQSKQVITPFRAHNFFLGATGGVDFSEPDEKGSLVPKYFDGSKVHVTDATPTDRAALFYSYSLDDYERGIFREKKIALEQKADGTQRLTLNGKEVLAVTRGKGFKGPYHCISINGMLRSVFLPGDRYFLINVHCGNYQGQLLIDVSTGAYKVLPKETRVYPTMNTRTFPRREKGPG